VQIRRVMPADLTQLGDLWQEQQTIITQWDSRRVKRRPDRRQWLGQTTLRLQSTAWRWYAAEVDAQVVGYIAGQVPPKSSEGIQYGIIDEIALDAHTYHSGVGRELYAAISVWFAEMSVTKLLVKAPRYYPVAQAFWRALGASEWPSEMPLNEIGELPPGCIWLKLTIY